MEKALETVFNPTLIERELVRLERESSSGGARATLFNLLIFTDRDPAVQAQADGLLGYLLGKRSARVIRVRSGDEERTRVEVAARCIPDRQDRGVCFQEISISSGLDGVGNEPGTWTSLLVRDIPVHVLWLESLAGNERLLDYAAEIADKIIIDGDRSRGLAPGDLYAEVNRLLLDAGVVTADFAWRRLAFLRCLTARLFEEGGRLEDLSAISSVEARGGDAVSVWLYHRWLSRQLDWRESEAVDRSAPAVAHLQAAAGTLPRRIDFSLQSGSRLAIRLDPDGAAEFLAGSKSIATLSYQTPEDGEILLRELDFPSADPLYIKTIGPSAARQSGSPRAAYGGPLPR